MACVCLYLVLSRLSGLRVPRAERTVRYRSLSIQRVFRARPPRRVKGSRTRTRLNVAACLDLGDARRRRRRQHNAQSGESNNFSIQRTQCNAARVER
jgi:hypothetical protein